MLTPDDRDGEREGEGEREREAGEGVGDGDISVCQHGCFCAFCAHGVESVAWAQTSTREPACAFLEIYKFAHVCIICMSSTCVCFICRSQTSNTHTCAHTRAHTCPHTVLSDICITYIYITS